MRLEALELDEHQRQAIDVADHVRAAQPQAPTHPQLPHGLKAVVAGAVEVDQAQAFIHQPADAAWVGAAVLHRHALAQQRVFLLVEGDQGLGDVVLQHLRQRLAVSLGWQARVEALQGGQHLAAQHHLGILAAAQQAVLAKVFVVLGKHGLPAERLLQQLGRRRLDQQVFGIIPPGHLVDSLPYRYPPSTRPGCIVKPCAAGRTASRNMPRDRSGREILGKRDAGHIELAGHQFGEEQVAGLFQR